LDLSKDTCSFSLFDFGVNLSNNILKACKDKGSSRGQCGIWSAWEWETCLDL